MAPKKKHKAKSSQEKQLDIKLNDSSKTRKGATEVAKDFLVPGYFFSTNATFPEAISDCKSPLEEKDLPPLTFSPLTPAEEDILDSKHEFVKGKGWDPVRVTLETSVWFTKDGKRGLAKRHPTFVANYDQKKNEAIIFLASGTKANCLKEEGYATLRATGKEASDEASEEAKLTVAGPCNALIDEAIGDASPTTGSLKDDEKLLITVPPAAFTKTTYLNLSHPIRVQPLFIGSEGARVI